MNTNSVAEVFLSTFSWVSLPREILSNLGTEFNFQLMSELHKLLGAKPSFTTLLYPNVYGMCMALLLNFSFAFSQEDSK